MVWKLYVRALERALTSLGCAGDVLVEEACDGQEACAAVHDDAKNRKRCVVLCLLDLAMPIMGGCAAARRLRAAGATAPVVAVTAAALPREEFEDDDDDSRAALQDLDDDDDAIALAFDAASEVISIRSEQPQNQKRNHPRPRLMDTSRIDGVKAPQHRGTPRSTGLPTQVRRRDLQAVRLWGRSFCRGTVGPAALAS